MNIGTEQVFIVNTADLDQHTSTPLQRAFAMPLPGASLQPEEAQASMCMPQSMGAPSRTQMCRLCATVTEMVVPIFEGEGLQNNLADKIHQHLPIQVSENDVLPVVMCFQCTSTLLAWHELVVCSVQADSAMRERFNLAFPTHQQQPGVQSSHNHIKDEKSQALHVIIKDILTQYLQSLNMDSQVELVCQSCNTKPSLTAEEFTEHIITLHSEVKSREFVHLFIKENVTFEEPLHSDLESDNYDRDDSDEKESVKTVKEKKISTVLCPHCDAAFTSPSRLLHHLASHAPLSLQRGVECCGHSYHAKTQYVAHLQERHVGRLVRDSDTACKSCGHSARSAGELRDHVLETHGDDAGKEPRTPSARNQKFIPAVCPVCNHTFSNVYNMLTHMKRHERAPAPRHACGACGKLYSSKGNLRQHERLAHEGELRHVCGACGERFPSRLARDVHRRLHSGARPFRCDLCRAAFRAENSLRRHLDSHLDVRRHACDLCGKAFRKSSHLAAHARTHRV